MGAAVAPLDERVAQRRLSSRYCNTKRQPRRPVQLRGDSGQNDSQKGSTAHVCAAATAVKEQSELVYQQAIVVTVWE